MWDVPRTEVDSISGMMQDKITDGKLTIGELEELEASRILEAKRYVDSKRATPEGAAGLKTMIDAWTRAYEQLQVVYQTSRGEILKDAGTKAAELRKVLDAGLPAIAAPISDRRQSPPAGLDTNTAIVSAPPAEAPVAIPANGAVPSGPKPAAAPAGGPASGPLKTADPGKAAEAGKGTEVGKSAPAAAPSKPDAKKTDGKQLDGKQPDVKLTETGSSSPEALKNKINNLTPEEREKIAASLDIIGKLPVIGEFIKSIIEVFVLWRKPAAQKEGQKPAESIDKVSIATRLDKLLAEKTADNSKPLLETWLLDMGDSKNPPKKAEGKKVLSELGAILGKTDQAVVAGKEELVYGDKMQEEVKRLQGLYKISPANGQVDRKLLELHLAELKKEKAPENPAVPAQVETTSKAPETGKVSVNGNAHIRNESGISIGSVKNNQPVTILDNGTVTEMTIEKKGKKQQAQMLHVKIGNKDCYIGNDLVKRDAPVAAYDFDALKKPAPAKGPTAAQAPAVVPSQGVQPAPAKPAAQEIH